MRILFFILPLFLVHCFEKTEVDCGCEDRRRQAVEVMGTMDINVYQNFLFEIEEENLDIYGVCLMGDSVDRLRVIFCADDEREYREFSNRTSGVSFSVTKRIER